MSEQDLNRIFLKYAMNREALFRKKTVSAAGNVSTAVFYGISGIVFLMILTGIPAAPFLAPQTGGAEQGLRRIGIRRWYRFSEMIVHDVLLMAVTAGGYGWAVQKGYALAGREELAAWGLTCAAVSAWILLFYEVCRSSAAAILTLFAVNVVFLFLAGGIIPVRLSAGAGSESRKYDSDGALDGWNPLYCFGRGDRGGSGAVETGCGGIGHALHWRLPPGKRRD